MPKPEVLTVEEGLGIRDVKAIAQDGHGMMWFATTQGVERFDGLNFVKYGSDPLADFLFAGGNVSNENMVIVNDTTLWVLADGILFSLDLNAHKTTDLSKANQFKGKVHTLRQGPDGAVWVVRDADQEQILLRYLESDRTFREIARAKLLHMPFNDVAADTSGNAWWSTNVEGLRLFSPGGEQLHSVKADSLLWYGTKIYFTDIQTDSKNRLFVFPKSQYSIWRYLPESGKKEVIADNLGSRVYSSVEDRQGNLWFSSFDGLFHMDQFGNLTDYSPSLRDRLQFSNIRHLFLDRTNLLWIATDNGLLKMPVGQDLFQNYMTVPGRSWGNAMRGIFADNEGTVYAYCENGQKGLHQIDIENKKTRLVFPFGDSLMAEPILDRVDQFVFDKNEYIAWASNDNLLKITFPEKKGYIEKNLTGVSETVTRNPFCILRDGNFILGSEVEKLVTYDRVNGQFTNFIQRDSNFLHSSNVAVIHEDNNGAIWVGTDSQGLLCFNRKGEILARFSTDSKPALSANNILAMHFDSKGRVWLATYGGGLNCLSGDLEYFRNVSNKVFTEKEGLSDNNVVSLLEDEAGNIWAGTYNGLSCYKVSEGAFRNFFEEDGLSHNEFNYASYFVDDEGGFWLGGMNGINYFKPGDLLRTEHNPPLFLTGFSKFDRRNDTLESRVIGSSETIGRITISPSVSWFQFNWTIPNYYKSEKSGFYTRLKGQADTWSYLGSAPFQRFNKLPPGDYILQIKGSDSKGIWSEGELTIPITVKPFFYQTWWFSLVVLAIVAAVGFAIARYRLNQLLKMERMRIRIASDLHDEVGSMLSGLAMQVELLEMSASHSDRSKLSRIADLSRTAVSKMRDLVWSIDSRRDKLKDLLERMQEQAIDFLQPRDIVCHFELGELPLEKKLPVDVRQHLFLIFKEALNNVVRHSDATEVKVCFGNFGDEFILSIHDNGSQKESNKEVMTGLGLSNMKMRANKLNADLNFRKNGGFTIILTLKSI